MSGPAMLLVALAAFAVGLAGTAALLRAGDGALVLDHPNARSLHDAPVPRGGGLAIVAGIAVAAGILWALGEPAPAWPVAGAALIAAISHADDRAHVPATVRIAVHLVAGLALLAAGLRIDALALPGFAVALPAAAGAVATVLYVAWMVNLYNFMDGMDGFAGGMTAVGFAALALLALPAGDFAYAALALSAAGGALGFLVFNFPPARIFMGDVGASTLGFLAAALTLAGAARGHFPLWVGVLVFSPFVVDATVTLARRAWRRERIWKAHRTHYYQRLVRLGWGHRRTVLWEYALMAACGASALVAARAGPAVQWSVLIAWAVAYTVAARRVRALERARADSR